MKIRKIARPGVWQLRRKMKLKNVQASERRFKDMSPPTKEFYKLLMEGRIIHGGNPVMAWMAGNVVVDTDPAGNIKMTKAKSPEKIDGIVAAIMELDRRIRNEGQQQGSVYDERDMIVF